jgi:hypothetical protein
MSGMTRSLDDYITRLRELLPGLKANYHVETLEVFGSFVRGEQNQESDLDLLVTYHEMPSLFQFVALENYLSDHLGVKVDLVMKDSLKPFIQKHILDEAQSI